MKRERLRGKWLEIHAQYPDKSSSQIRKNNDGVYAWLKRYDSEWMEENYRRMKTVVNTVDWDKRDAELLPKVGSDKRNEGREARKDNMVNCRRQVRD